MSKPRLPNKATRELAKELAPDGWVASLTRGNHVRLTHLVHGTVFASGTASDRRAVENVRAQIRRCMRAGAVPA